MKNREPSAHRDAVGPVLQAGWNRSENQVNTCDHQARKVPTEPGLTWGAWGRAPTRCPVQADTGLPLAAALVGLPPSRDSPEQKQP